MANPDIGKPSGDQPPAPPQATPVPDSPTFDFPDSPTFELTSDDGDNAWFFDNAVASESEDNSGPQSRDDAPGTANAQETTPSSLEESTVPEPQILPDSSAEIQQVSTASAAGSKPTGAMTGEASDKDTDDDSEVGSFGSLFDEEDFTFNDDLFEDEPESIIDVTSGPVDQAQTSTGAESGGIVDTAMPGATDASLEDLPVEYDSITVASAPASDLSQPALQALPDLQDPEDCAVQNSAALDLPLQVPDPTAVKTGLQFPAPSVMNNDQDMNPALLLEPATVHVPGNGSSVPEPSNQQNLNKGDIVPGLSQDQENTMQQNSIPQSFPATDGTPLPINVGKPLQAPLQWFAVLEPMGPVITNEDQPAGSDQDAEGEEIEDAEFYAYLGAEEGTAPVATGDTDSTSKEGSEITDQAMISYPDHPRPSAWGPPKSIKPVFKYSTRGQWDVGTYYSTKALRFYVARCTRNLTIWLQTTPRCHDRQDSWDRMCRWAGCPDKGNPIRPGFFRCTFDEYSHLTTTGQKNPFHTAGCLHLYCFEQVFDAAKLHRRGRFLLDQREFAVEGNKNSLAVNRPPDRMITAAAFKPWLEKQPASHLIPADCWTPLPHEQSLGYELTVFRARVRPPRPSDASERSIESEHGQAMPMAEHKGDLQKLVDALKAAKDLKKKGLANRYLNLPPTQTRPGTRKGPSSVVSAAPSTSSLSTLDSDGGVPLTISSDEKDSAEEVHDIELIANMRRRKGKFEYEVKWSGSNNTTWEPEASLQQDLSEKDLRELVRDFAAVDRKRAEAKIRGLEERVAELIETVKQQKFELNRSHKRRRQHVDYTEYSEAEDTDARKREVLPLRKKARKSGHTENTESKSDRKREHDDFNNSSSRKRARRA